MSLPAWKSSEAVYGQEKVVPYRDDTSGKGTQVERMFNHIAHSYDRLNHILSLGIDRRWRRTAIRHLKRNAKIPPRQLLDIATGTGDFALLAQQELSPTHITGIDISDGMTAIARRKTEQRGLSSIISFRHEDCARMSFPDNSFDAIISAFGLRNFQNLDQCLSEMLRVLKPGGMLVTIDLATPVSFPMRQLFWIYKKCVMPVIGRCISHDNSAYTYLPDTMDTIPQAGQMADIFRKAGLRHVCYRRLAPGMCILYAAEKD